MIPHVRYGVRFEKFGSRLIRTKSRQRLFRLRQFSLHTVHLLAAKHAPLTRFHITRRHHPEQTSGQPAKDHKRQSPVESFAQGNIKLLTSSPNFIVAGKKPLQPPRE
jgi:RNase adaptor protein for sRNA GlmZ degradation